VTIMTKLDNDSLVFAFPDIHPEAKLSIEFQRTLRIPDDSKTYPLPPGLGKFPVRLVDDFKNNVSAEWREHGGVMLPMYQSEALWLRFHASRIPDHGQYQFAIKVSAGKRSAVTGKDWQSGLNEKDYLIIPKQPWLDGYVVSSGIIRQFVAAPLGAGVTVEEQLTGKAEFGGIQIEVFPMKWDAFEKHFPKRPPTTDYWTGSAGDSRKGTRSMMRSAPSAAAAPRSDMGLAAGGRMKQEIYADSFGIGEWDTTRSGRCFVHLANSLVWKDITNQAAPSTPATARAYTQAGLPWFDYYSDGPTLAATPELGGIKSVAEMAPHMLPENVSVEPKKPILIVSPPGSEVRDGKWA